MTSVGRKKKVDIVKDTDFVSKNLLSHPLENIEDVEEFYAAINRHHLTHAITKDRPYTYWTIELYDQKNGIRSVTESTYRVYMHEREERT